MPHDFRVYGHLVGLDGDRMKACIEHLSAYECDTQGNVLDFLHEGGFLDVDSDLEGLVPLMGPDARGVVDIINHQDWQMFRVTIEGGAMARSRIALDNALDTAYASEHPPGR
jgi:hypothetical protein